MLTVTNIIEGAYYAVDQAGQLLNDAALLYQRRRWPTSLVLSVFCLEELGKAEALLCIASDAANSSPKSVRQVQKGLTDHVAKLKSARKVTITASLGSWGDTPPLDITQQLQNVFEINQENAPKEAHALRKAAMFVDLRDDESWRRPAETTSDVAEYELRVARIEYSRCREIFVNPTDAVVRQALVELARRLPALPVF